MIEVTCAIILKGKTILVTQRGGDSEHAFKWEFPGGKINSGELASDCIQREIREELDLEITILKEMFAIQFDYGFKKIKLIPFLCTPKSSHFILKEHIQSKWIGLNEIQNIDFLEADKKLIEKLENWVVLEKYLRK